MSRGCRPAHTDWFYPLLLSNHSTDSLPSFLWEWLGRVFTKPIVGIQGQNVTVNLKIKMRVFHFFPLLKLFIRLDLSPCVFSYARQRTCWSHFDAGFVKVFSPEAETLTRIINFNRTTTWIHKLLISVPEIHNNCSTKKVSPWRNFSGPRHPETFNWFLTKKFGAKISKY